MKFTLIIFVSSLFVSCVYSPRTDKSTRTTTNNYYSDTTKQKTKDEDYVQFKQNDSSPALSDDAPFYNDGFRSSHKLTAQVVPDRSIAIPDRALVVHSSHYIPYTVIPPTVHYTVPVANRSIYYVERGF